MYSVMEIVEASLRHVHICEHCEEEAVTERCPNLHACDETTLCIEEATWEIKK